MTSGETTTEGFNGEIANEEKYCINEFETDWKNYKLPNGDNWKFVIANNHLRYIKAEIDKKTGEEEEINILVSLVPFVFVGRSEPLDDGTQYYTIRYGKDQQKEFVCKYTDIATISTMKKTFAEKGIVIEDKKHMLELANKYITFFRDQFDHKIRINETVNYNGWNEDGDFFAMGNTGITKHVISHINNVFSDPKTQLIKSHGTKEGWSKGIIPIMEYDISRFLIYNGLTAPLIKKTNSKNIVTVHNGNGHSSTGKTTLAHVLTSTLGNPAELELRADSTANGIVTHAKAFNDMPINVEEATKEESRKIIESAIYDLSNGTDKSRANWKKELGDAVSAKSKSFRTSARITVEQPITPTLKFQGGIARTTETAEQLPENIKQLINKTNETIELNNGWFFPKFVQHILRNEDRIGGLMEYAEEFLIIPDCIPAESHNMIGRQQKAFALTYVSGVFVEELFKEFGIPVKSPKEIENMIYERFVSVVCNEPMKPMYIRALEEVNTWLTTTNLFLEHGEKLIGNRTIIGEYTTTELKINSAAFKNKMLEMNFNGKMVDDFLTYGVIDNKNSDPYINGKKSRGFIINRKRMEEMLGISTEEEEKLNLSQKMVFKEIHDSIDFLIRTLRHESVNPLLLKQMIRTDVSKYLEQMVTMGKIKKTPEGNYTF